jgi:ADP-heptose:LPS heptosyltransferase
MEIQGFVFIESKMKIPQEQVKKIGVFRALKLGDMLCAMPALRALHHAYPEASITLFGLPWARSLVYRFPSYIHSFIHFPGYPGLPEQKVIPADVTGFMNKVQEEHFDLILQMQGNGSIVNPMVELLGAKYTAGFCIDKDYCPDRNLFYSYPLGIHEIDRHLLLMDFLGIPLKGRNLEFPLFNEDFDDYRSISLSLIPGKYVCIHPGSADIGRRWPPEYFAAIADYCAGLGLKVVITGIEEELEVVREVERYMLTKPIIAAGKTKIGSMAVLIEQALLLISNCTGVSHIAAAVETPGVIISMDGEPERWGPLNTRLHRTVNWLATPDFKEVVSGLNSLLHYLQRNHGRNNSFLFSNKETAAGFNNILRSYHR